MRGSPLIIGLLVGLIVTLVISGVSLSVKMNSLNSERDKQLVEKRNCEVIAENLRDENRNLLRTVEELNLQIVAFQNKDFNKLKTELEGNSRKKLMRDRVRRKEVKE
ncbi:MAG: hypothetical protein NG737_00710 [Omnitrophica bacterium]|nr:hypothetical protein [Candidatus Omnitrophota bacterium]